MKTNEIESKNIGERVIKELKKVDDVAYLRFASVYKNFKDCKDFENEIRPEFCKDILDTIKNRPDKVKNRMIDRVKIRCHD